jgi:zinc D-Ala-D-Ala carboxypeptidase
MDNQIVWDRLFSRHEFLMLGAGALAAGAGILTVELLYRHGHMQVLREGSRGPSVREVQLKVAGWISDRPVEVYLEVDSDFGPQTDSAVRQFQQAFGLQVDGEVGPETQGALNRISTNDGASTHFSWETMGLGAAPAHRIPAETKDGLRRLMFKLEALQQKSTSDPILSAAFGSSGVVSCPLGGAGIRLHGLGIAADVAPRDRDLELLYQRAQTCGFSGLATSHTRTSGLVHVDSRIEDPRTGATTFAWLP